MHRSFVSVYKSLVTITFKPAMKRPAASASDDEKKRQRLSSSAVQSAHHSTDSDRKRHVAHVLLVVSL